MSARRRNISATRRGLLLTSALIGVAALPQVAAGQALPGAVPVGADAATRAAVTGDSTATNQIYDLNGANRIYDFTSFDIGNTVTVNFVNRGADAARLTAVNRIAAAAGISDIEGALRADDNISVWLINTAGIAFSSSGSFSGGSLVLSTMPYQFKTVGGGVLEEAVFPVFGPQGASQFQGTSTGSISLNGGPGGITATNGSIVAVAQNISSTKTLSATGGSIALIAGTDVTFSNGVGNPLNFVINAGTTIATAAIDAGGSMSGQSLRIAGGINTAVNAALLGVRADASLVATAADGSIVISTVRPADLPAGTNPAAPGIEINGRLTAGAATVDGPLTSVADIIVNGIGNVTVGGATFRSGRDVRLAAADVLNSTGGSVDASRDAIYQSGGALTVGGGVLATRDYRATGASVTLGSTAAPVVQSAGGLVAITALNGDITGNGALTLQSNSLGTSAGAAGTLTLSAVNGGIAFTAPTLANVLAGTEDARSDVLIAVDDAAATGNVTLGQVRGNALLTLGNADNLLLVPGAFESGAIDVTRPLGIRADGALRVRGDVTVRDFTAGDTAAGIDLRGADVRVDGTMRTNGRDILATATRDLTLLSAATILLPATVPTAGAITLRATRDLSATGTLASGTAFSAEAGRNARLATVIGGTGIDVRAGTGEASVTQGSATAGNIAVQAGGAVSLATGTATAGSIALLGRGDVTSTVSLTAGEDIAVATQGAATFGTLSAGDDIDFSATGRVSLVSANATGIAAGPTPGAIGVQFTLANAGSTGAGGIAFAAPDTLPGGSSIRIRGSDVVGTGPAPTGIDLRGFNIDVAGTIRTAGRDILVSARNNATIAGAITALTGTTTTAGTVAIYAGNDVTTTAATIAGEDVAVRALRDASLDSISAGDDAAITVTRTLTVSGITTRDPANLVDARAVVFDDAVGAVNRINFGAETTLAGSNIALTATTLLSAPALAGSTDAGLVAESIFSRGAAMNLLADAGDIRLGSLTASNPAAATTVTATLGSVTGLRSDPAWTATSSGSTLTTPGNVTINVATAATIGAIDADGAVTNVAGLTSIRVGDITAGSVNLQATQNLQVGDLDVNGNVTLRTTAGASMVPTSLTGTDLMSGYLRAGDGIAGTGAGLSGGLTLTVSAAERIAKLGTITGGSVVVGAAALDVTRAVSTGTTLQLIASDGRLTLGSGNAATTATLWKRNDDLVGDPDAGDALFVTDTASGLVAGTGIDIRSVTDLTVQRATTTAGDLRAQATRDATLNVGAAALAAADTAPGTLALLAGRNVVSTGSLSAREDVAVHAGGTASLGTTNAGDDIDLFAVGRLTLGDATTTALVGPDNRAVTFTQGLAGQGDPVATPTSGGIAIGAPEALPGSRIRIRAGDIGASIPTPVDRGLVVGALTAGVTDLTAATGDIRVGTATTTGNLTVTAQAGSVSGLLAPVSTGGATLRTSGDVTLQTGGTVSLGGIITDGAINASGTLTSVRIGTVQGASVNLTSASDLQINTVAVGGGTAALTTTGGATAGFSAVGTPLGDTAAVGTRLVADRGDAGLVTTGVLRVNAVQGAAQLGAIKGTGVTVVADAVSVVRAETTDAAQLLSLTAERGRLALGTGIAAGAAALVKRNDAALVPVSDANALFVGRADLSIPTGGLTAASGIAISSTSDATVTSAVTAAGNLTVDAYRNVTLNEGVATAGSLAIRAGSGSVTSNLRLVAGNDVAIRSALGTRLEAATGARQLVSAGDDIDLDVGGTLFITDALANGGTDGSSIVFGGTPGVGGIAINPAAGENAALIGRNIRIVAGAVTGPGVAAQVDDGIVVDDLRSGSAAITALAGAGGSSSDIRIRTATTLSGALTADTARGSVTGLLTGWANSAGSATLRTPGTVRITSSGAIEVGTIEGVTAGSFAGTVTGGASGTSRYGTISAATLTLTAPADIQLGTARVTNAATLTTTNGSAETGLTLAPASQTALFDARYGRANLIANGVLTVRAAADATLIQPIGVAQLGTISGSSLSVIADAIDVVSATTSVGQLYLQAERGRLTLATGDAETQALLWKRDKDAVAGTPASTVDALFVNSLTAGTDIDVRSATDATVALARATNGNLGVQAMRDATLTDGVAGVGVGNNGSLALLAGTTSDRAGNISSTSLVATRDVSLSAGGNATLGLVQAGDDAVLLAGGALTFTKVDARATDTTVREIVLTAGQAGQGAVSPVDPLAVIGGGAAFDTTRDTLAGSSVFIRAGSVGGTPLAGAPGTGLVVEKLTSGTARLTAATGDIRLGGADTSGAGTGVTTTGLLSVEAVQGSVTGLGSGREGISGGSQIVALGRAGEPRGNVTIESPGAVSIGSITAGGTVSGGGISVAPSGTVTGFGVPAPREATGIVPAGSIRVRTIDAANLTLTAAGDLQLGTATVTGDTALRTTGGAALGGFDLAPAATLPATPFTIPLDARFGRADLIAGGVLTVSAAVDPSDAATGPIGIAQLGTIRGDSLGVTADAVDVVSARTITGQLYLQAERGRLTLGTGDAATQALLWKRDKDTVAGTAASVDDALFVTTLGAGAGIDARSATDATVTTAIARGGDLAVQATRDAKLATGTAAAGTLVLSAGRDASSLLTLTATKDVVVYGGRDTTLGTPGASARHQVSAGDDIDLFAGRTLYFADLATTGTLAQNPGGVTILPTEIGLRDPRTPGTGAVRVGDETPGAGTVRLRATDITGPGLSGSTDNGLVVGRLNSGNAALTAAAGDIRVGNATTVGGLTVPDGNLSVTATLGSISGLRTGWLASGGGSTIKTPGQVIVAAGGTVSIGAIDGATVGAGAGAIDSTSAGSTRYGMIVASSLNATAGPNLQVGTADVTGATRLTTTSGSASAAISLTDPTLVAGYGRANLIAGSVLTVRASMDTALAQPVGVAQLDTISGTSLSVIADAIDVLKAMTSVGQLYLQAERGRLTLTAGDAETKALLWKRDKDAVIGTPASATDALFVNSLLAGTDIDVRSATDATVSLAATANGNLGVQAAGFATLTDGAAGGTGSLALLAGTGPATSTQLVAARDVSVSTGGDATLGLVQAGDDAVLLTGGALRFVKIDAQATDTSVGEIVFTTAQAGQGTVDLVDPLAVIGGGVAFDTTRDTLAGSSVFIRAGSVGGTPLAGAPGTGLVVEKLTSGTARLTAATGDIRLGGADTSGAGTGVTTTGLLSVEAVQGSVTGLGSGREGISGGSQIVALGRAGEPRGNVTIESPGAVSIGSITAGGTVSGGGISVAPSGTVTGFGVPAPREATGIVPAGSIRVRTIDAANLTLTAAGDLQLGTATVTGDTALRTTGGAALGGFDLAPAATLPATPFTIPLDARFGRADLIAGGVLTVSAAVDPSDAATGPIGIAQLGTTSGYSLSVTADAVDVGSAKSNSGTLDLLAERGRLTLGTGTVATQATLVKQDKDAVTGEAAAIADALFVGTITAGTGIDARSATDATIASAKTTAGSIYVQAARDATLTTGNAAGRLIISAGRDARSTTKLEAGAGIDVRAANDASVTLATASDGDLLLQAARDASLGEGTATTGTLALLAGRNGTSATSLTAGEDVAVQTVGTAALGAIKAGDDVAVFAGGDLTLGSATTTGAGGDTRSVTFTPALAGQGVPPTVDTGGIKFDAEVTSPVTARLAGTNIRLETRGQIAINGAVSATGGTATIRLVNGGTRITAIGAAAANGFVLDDAEMDRLSAATVIIDSGANALSIGTLSIADVTGSSTLKLLTSGAITLSGAITGNGTVARTLQIGGNDGGPRVSDGSNLATSLTADTGGAGDGAGIDFDGTVDLRAKRLLFGTGAEFLAFGAATNDVAARAVANAGSSLYLGNRTRENFLTVSKLSVSYSDFALFQNTIPGVSGGAVLGPTGNSVSNLALQLYSTGDNRDNSFAIFGTINGFIGRAAGVLPNDVLNIADENPRTLRVTQSNTRVNGCVIGSPDRGCLITDVPRTEFRLYDERQTQLITAAEDPSLYANPLIGRGNEGLIVDIADVPVGIDTIDCPKDEPNCPSPRNPK